VEEQDFVTIVKAKDFLDKWMETKGRKVFYLGQNMAIWAGMSSSFCAILLAVIDKGRVRVSTCSDLTYAADGCILHFPLVGKKIPKQGYEKPHWLPVCLRPVKKGPGQEE
jgi:hypothetical protein